MFLDNILFFLLCLTLKKVNYLIFFSLRWGNWVLATISNFQITVSYQPNVVDLGYFKLTILLDQIILIWNIKGLHHQVEKIKGLEISSLWLKFTLEKIQCLKSKKIVYCNVKGILSNLEGINYWYEKGIYLLIIQTLPEISEPNDVLLVWFYAFKQITI